MAHGIDTQRTQEVCLFIYLIFFSKKNVFAFLFFSVLCRWLNVECWMLSNLELNTYFCFYWIVWFSYRIHLRNHVKPPKKNTYIQITLLWETKQLKNVCASVSRREFMFRFVFLIPWNSSTILFLETLVRTNLLWCEYFIYISMPMRYCYIALLLLLIMLCRFKMIGFSAIW